MLKPLSNRVIALIDAPATQTKSGILLGEAQEKPAYAVIAAVGPEVKTLKKGDKILYKEYSATSIKVDDTDYLIIEDKDVLATL
jgi:chaperonin GroES